MFTAIGALLGTLNSPEFLKLLLKKLLQEEPNLKLDQLIKTFQEVKSEIFVPLSIFSHKLKPAEALCQYLKEKEGLSNKQIAVLINRKEKSVWATCQRAVQKKKPGKQKFIEKEKKYFLPVSIFSNRSYSLLGNVIIYLKEVHHLSNKSIAELLDTSPNSIAVIAKRGKEA